MPTIDAPPAPAKPALPVPDRRPRDWTPTPPIRPTIQDRIDIDEALLRAHQSG